MSVRRQQRSESLVGNPIETFGMGRCGGGGIHDGCLVEEVVRCTNHVIRAHLCTSGATIARWWRIIASNAAAVTSTTCTATWLSTSLAFIGSISWPPPPLPPPFPPPFPLPRLRFYPQIHPIVHLTQQLGQILVAMSLRHQVEVKRSSCRHRRTPKQRL